MEAEALNTPSINDKAYQREIIDTFLNSVYVYDDKIVFTYDLRDHAETVTLDEIEYVFCSDVNDCPPPTPRRFWCGVSLLCKAIVQNAILDEKGRRVGLTSGKSSDIMPTEFENDEG